MQVTMFTTAAELVNNGLPADVFRVDFAEQPHMIPVCVQTPPCSLRKVANDDHRLSIGLFMQRGGLRSYMAFNKLEMRMQTGA